MASGQRTSRRKKCNLVSSTGAQEDPAAAPWQDGDGSGEDAEHGDHGLGLHGLGHSPGLIHPHCPRCPGPPEP